MRTASKAIAHCAQLWGSLQRSSQRTREHRKESYFRTAGTIVRSYVTSTVTPKSPRGGIRRLGGQAETAQPLSFCTVPLSFCTVPLSFYTVPLSFCTVPLSFCTVPLMKASAPWE